MVKTSNKTLAVTLRFWTNDLKVVNSTRELACWDSGIAILEANKDKKIKSVAVPFNCPDDVVRAIRHLFRKQKIMLVSDCGKPRAKFLSNTR